MATRSCRRVAASLLLLLIAVYARADDAPAALRRENGAAVACTDVGVELRIRRSPAMPLEELSELHTGKTCATATIMTLVADDAAGMLDQAALDVVDCVTTRIDEELLGLYAVMRVCNRPAVDSAAMALEAWDAFIRPKLQALFGAASGGPDGLQYHRSAVECENLVVPASYTRALPGTGPDDSEVAPRFRYKSTELWSLPGSVNSGGSLVVLKLKVKNDGSAPLHVFAAAVKVLDEAPSNGVLVLSPEAVEAVMPSTELTVTFRVDVPHQVEFPDEVNCLVYFAHTSSRAHVLEGRLDGKKLKPTNDIKKKKSPGKVSSDLLGLHKVDNSVTLEAAYTSLPFGAWQLASMGIVVIVGLVTTVYMRRKWMRIQWSLDCLTAKKLKHKSSSLTKMTELTSKQPAYEPENSDDADMDALESDGFLPASSMGASLPPRKKTMAKLREKMPAIRMQWKKPDILRGSHSTSRSLSLDFSARLDPKRFETLWDQFVLRHSASFQAAKRPTVEIVVQSMAGVGIACMASGTVNGVEKYVLYAKQTGSSDLFFVAVDIFLSSSETNLSVRTSKDTNDALVQQFVALVDEQLALLLK